MAPDSCENVVERVEHGRTVEFGDHIYAASRYSFALSMLA